MPARKTLDCYTTLGRHAQITRENYGGYMGVVTAGVTWPLVPRHSIAKDRHAP